MQRVAFWAVLVAAIFAAQDLHAVPQKKLAPITVASGGRARVSIVMDARAAESYRFAATACDREGTCGFYPVWRFPSSPMPKPPPRPAFQEALMVVGGSEASDTAREAVAALRMDIGGLKPDGFLIKTGRLRNRTVVVVAGKDSTSTMYGVYELVARLGVTFRLTGDIIPRPQDPLLIPPLDVRMEPAMARRGFLLQDAGYENLTMLSHGDYAKLIDQMAKMKCNYLQFWWFSFAPWLKYGYKGESKQLGDVSTKESGYLTWAYGGFGSRTTDDVSIGKERFPNRRIAPPEMWNVETLGPGIPGGPGYAHQADSARQGTRNQGVARGGIGIPAAQPGTLLRKSRGPALP